MKRFLVILLSVLTIVPFICSCSTTSSSSETTLTLDELEEWCEASAKTFFEGFVTRDKELMSSVCYNQNQFKSSYEDFFENQDKKVWLTTFYDNYLAGSQAIPSVFSSTTENGVRLKYAIVCADYSSGNRNWLLMYTITLKFEVDTSKRTAKISNSDEVFKLYDDMCNDYTTHVAALALGVDENFNASEYYYDEDTGLYIPYETEPVITTPETTVESAESEVTTNATGN